MKCQMNNTHGRPCGDDGFINCAEATHLHLCATHWRQYWRYVVEDGMSHHVEGTCVHFEREGGAQERGKPRRPMVRCSNRVAPGHNYCAGHEADAADKSRKQELEWRKQLEERMLRVSPAWLMGSDWVRLR